MMNFISQHWGSILVGLLVVAAAALAVNSLRSNKKKGKLSCSYGCSGGCTGCSASHGCSSANADISHSSTGDSQGITDLCLDSKISGNLDNYPSCDGSEKNKQVPH